MSPDDRRVVVSLLTSRLPSGCEARDATIRGVFGGTVMGLIEVCTAGIGDPKAGIRTTGVRRISIHDREAWWTGDKEAFTGPHKGRGWRDRLVADVVAAVVEDARQLAAKQ